jgi:hypothetical protein
MSALARLGLISGLLLETMIVSAQEGQVGRAEASAPAAARLPTTGACCRCSVCTVETEQACWELGGAWQGENTTCDPSPCVVVYCAPGAEVCDEYISRVQIGTVDNPSGCEAGQYADYTYLSTDLPIGPATSLTVTNGNPIWSADVCSVWIDWNHDCIVDDYAPEALGDLSGVGPYDFSITVPDTALPGPARLRIRIDYSNADPEPCGTAQYGEVEDYTVVVVELPGACCWPDGACTIETQSACGGYWGGAGSACANADCDNNGVDDYCDLNPVPWCRDADGNGILDDCEPDCNGNGVPDTCEAPGGCDVGQCDWCYPDTCGTGPDCNNNGVLDDCDVANGTSCDCQGDGIPDECQLWVEGPPITVRWDDGSSENSIGLNGGGELCWMQHFVAPAGVILGIQTCFGTPSDPNSSGVNAGQMVRVYVWSDPNGDGNPADAVFLSEATGVVEAGSIDTDVFQTIPINQPIDGSFFIGASVVTSTGDPAPMDQSAYQYDQAWVAFNTVPFDPSNVAANLYNMTDIGYPCNFLLRARASFGLVPNDCNEDGIPDECDVGVEWGGYCAGQGPPCFPGLCAIDCSLSGNPCLDGGDLNNDLLVNMDDYWVFMAAFGTCVGQPGYNASADIDGDGCITLVDYQMWRCYYEQANGKEFVLPKPKPLTMPGVAK